MTRWWLAMDPYVAFNSSALLLVLVLLLLLLLLPSALALAAAGYAHFHQRSLGMIGDLSRQVPTHLFPMS